MGQSPTMRRGPLTLLVSSTLVLVAACGPDERVSNVSSQEIADTTPTTNPTDPTAQSTDPTTPPGPTTPTGPTTGPTAGPGTPGTVSPSLPPPETATPQTADVEVPPGCTELPDEAPAIIVTGNDGVVYQVGADGTQIIADSESLPASIDAAWRAKGGALWVGLEGTLSGDASIGRLDARAYTEIATGRVNVQHIGVIDGTPVALWFDYGGLGGNEGRAVIEDADGNQTEVAKGTDGAFSLATGGIGGDGVALTEESIDDQRFRYVDTDGEPIDDWYNPTERAQKKGGPRYMMATPSPDGSLISWGEAPAYDSQSGRFEGTWNLVVARTKDGTETFRAEVGEPGDFVSTGDFDGRWFLVSLTSATVLVDTTKDSGSAAIVPCIPRGAATLDRGGGGTEPPPTSTSTSTTSTSTSSAPPSPSNAPPATEPGSPGVEPIS